MANRTLSAYPMTLMEDATEAVRAAAEAYGRVAILLPLSDRRTVGSVTAARVVCATPVPPVACSRLDGYAVRSGAPAGSVYRIVARVRPGASPPPRLDAGEAVWITTGAPLPPGADAVIGVEETVVPSGGAVDGAETVQLAAAARPGDSVRAVGSDVEERQELLPAHHRLTPADIALLASSGITSVLVYRQPTVGVMSTGDEVDPLPTGDLALEGHHTVGATAYRPLDSNRPMLMALLASVGANVVDLGIVRDDAGAVERTLASALHEVDVLVTSGGVSMGDRDFVKPALEAAAAASRATGGRVVFGRLNMKPGKPTTFALLPPTGSKVEECAALAAPPRLVFALPGNPVSAWVCAHALVLPAVRALGGLPWAHAALEAGAVRVTVLDGVALDPQRPEFHRAIVWAASPRGSRDAPSALWARSTGAQASSRLASAAVLANALLWLPAAHGTREPPFTADAFLVAPLAPASALGTLADTALLRPTSVTGSSHSSCACGAAHSDGPAAHARDLGDAAHPPRPRLDALSPQPAASAAVRAPPTAAAALPSVRLCVLTVSDSAAARQAADTSGPLLVSLALAALGDLVDLSDAVSTAIVADDAPAITEVVSSWASTPLPAGRARLILTTGGTGFGPRDVTPEAIRPIMSRPAHGLVHALLAGGLRSTPLAALSRYEAGTVGLPEARTLLVELPGSEKAVRECMAVLAPLLPHALKLTASA